MLILCSDWNPFIHFPINLNLQAWAWLSFSTSVKNRSEYWNLKLSWYFWSHQSCITFPLSPLIFTYSNFSEWATGAPKTSIQSKGGLRKEKNHKLLFFYLLLFIKSKHFSDITQTASNYCRQILVITLITLNATKESFYNN